MTEQEKLLQAKIPGQETGIEVKRGAFAPSASLCSTAASMPM